MRDFPRRVETVGHLWIPVDEKVRLSARMWLPEDASDDPVPAILEAIPYRKDDVTAVDDSSRHPYVAGHGYAVLRLDLRGSGDSEGTLLDEYHPSETEDLVRAIEWIAAQPWCTGSVGMTGISWSGFNSLQVAARRPPALKAIITACSSDDRYDNDVHYMGGSPLGYYLLPWATAMQAFCARPPDPQVVGESWREMWMERLRSNPVLIETWLKHQRRDEYWDQGSVCADYSAIECPVYAVGGWADAYTDSIFRLMAELDCPRRAIVGPWGHAWPQVGVPGPAIGFLEESVRWWDHWLKGIDDGMMGEPMIRAWMQDSVPPDENTSIVPGRWVGQSQWPPADPRAESLWLGDGTLSPVPPNGPVLELSHSSPLDVGISAGAWCSYGNPADQPGDQRSDDARSLGWTSAPLTDPLEILGQPTLSIRVAADRPRAFLAARLCDVAPDGASTLITRGVLNLCHREGHDVPQDLDPGTGYDVTIPLKTVGYSLPAGHRVRISVSTSMWPWIWPSPDPVTVTISTGEASALSLPLFDPDDDGRRLRTLGPPETSAPVELEWIRQPAPALELTTDLVTGDLTYEMARDFVGVKQFTDGLAYGDEDPVTFTINRDDPLSMRVECRRTVSISRGDWSVKLELRSTMAADAGDWRVTTSLHAFEGETCVYVDAGDYAIPRDHN